MLITVYDDRFPFGDEACEHERCARSHIVAGDLGAGEPRYPFDQSC
jgi:hypothetical protein